MTRIENPKKRVDGLSEQQPAGGSAGQTLSHEEQVKSRLTPEERALVSRGLGELRKTRNLETVTDEEVATWFATRPEEEQAAYRKIIALRGESQQQGKTG